jgi:hypothetical protein
MLQSVRGNTKYDSTRLSTMTREERLQQANNGSPEDEKLQSLILAVEAAKKGSFAHRRVIEQLVKYASSSSNLTRNGETTLKKPILFIVVMFNLMHWCI